MMIRLLQIILFSIGVFYSAFAQRIQLSSPIGKIDDSNYQLVDKLNDSLIVINQVSNRIIVESYNDSLDKFMEKTLDFSPIQQIHLLKAISKNKEISILYYYQRKGATYIKSRVIDGKANTLSDDLILSCSGLVHFSVEEDISISPDQRYLTFKYYSSKHVAQLLCYDIIDKTVFWRKHITSKNLCFDRHYKKIITNNLGQSFMMCHKFIPSQQESYVYIFEFDADSTEHAYTLDLKGYRMGDFNISYDHIHDKVMVLGFYGESSFYAQGIFSARFNVDESYKMAAFNDFDQTLMRSFTGKKKDNIKGLHNIFIDDVILRRDGGALIVSEQHFVYEKQYTDRGDQQIYSSKADFLYENILLTSIHPTGELHWNEVLHKSQSSENDEGKYSSFFLFKTNRSIRFVYNNDIRRGTSIFEYVVQGNGEVQRNVLSHQSKGSDLLPNFRNSLQTSANEMVVLSESNRKWRLMQINY